jgi:hypothetical protein
MEGQFIGVARAAIDLVLAAKTDDERLWPDLAFAVDRAVEDARSQELVAAQGAEEGQCLPMTMRLKAPLSPEVKSPP